MSRSIALLNSVPRVNDITGYHKDSAHALLSMMHFSANSCATGSSVCKCFRTFRSPRCMAWKSASYWANDPSSSFEGILLVACSNIANVMHLETRTPCICTRNNKNPKSSTLSHTLDENERNLFKLCRFPSSSVWNISTYDPECEKKSKKALEKPAFLGSPPSTIPSTNQSALPRTSNLY